MSADSSNKIKRICFYSLWLLVSILQACYTELLEDEAYYWVFAQNLDWGYYENSPMVAAMIKAGYAIFPNDFGVRFFSIMMITAYIYLLELLIKPKNVLYYYFTITSIAVVHILGILSVPDTPLLFFGICFYHMYKRYLQNDNALSVILLALNIALLLFSKYHGILVVAFTVASNPALFKKKSFWATALLAAVFFSPHIWWQYSHDFPTIKFNLAERFNLMGGYTIMHAVYFFAAIPLVYAPVTGLVMLFQSIKRKPQDKMERAFKFIVIGVFTFFFLMTFRGHSEGNWTLSALAPAVYLGYKEGIEKRWYKKFIQFAFGITIVLVLCLRVYMVKDVFGIDAHSEKDIHNWKDWALQIKEQADGRPVVFMNTYQQASMYRYYAQEEAITLSNRCGKRTQYDLWDYENQLQGKDVMVIPNYEVNRFDTFKTVKGSYNYTYADNFRTTTALVVKTEVEEITATPQEHLSVPCKFSDDGMHEYDLEASPSYPAVVHALYFKKGVLVKDESIEFYIKNDMIDNNKTYELKTFAPQEKGEYVLFLDVASGWLPPGINVTHGIKLTVK